MIEITAKEKHLKAVMVISAIIYLVVGFAFLIVPESILKAFNLISQNITPSLPEIPTSMGKFWVALSFSMMMTIATLCYIVQHNIRKNKGYIIPLLISKTASALSGLFLFIFSARYLANLAITLVDGSIFWITLFFYIRANRAFFEAQTAYLRKKPAASKSTGTTTVAALKGDDKFELLDRVLEETKFFEVLDGRFKETGKSREDFSVVVKPNFMFMYSRNDVSTYTDPELVEYLINLIHKQGFSNIAVVEAQSTYGNYFKNREVMKVAQHIGYSEKNYKIVDLTEERVPYDFGGRLGIHPVGPTWRDADFRISFAKNKTHTFCYYTLTIKNVYGALAMGNKLKEYHTKREIYWPTIEMLKHFPVDYGLVDAYISADGQFGIFADRYPNSTKTIIGGMNLIAVDWVGAKKMGIDPMVSRYMKLAVAAFGMPQINWIGDRTEYMPWRNVNRALIETVDRIEELYGFSNTLFMAINDMDPYFKPQKRTFFVKLLRMLFRPIRDLIMRERVDINSLNLMQLDPNKKVRILRQGFLIKAERMIVYRSFLENFEVLLPGTLQITRKVTPGQARVGTRYTAIPNFLTRPMVNVEIIAIQEGKELVYGYLEGSPFSGRNSVVFKDSGLGTDIEVTLHYQLRGVANWFGWYLLGGKRFHKRLVIEGTGNLNALLEEK